MSGIVQLNQSLINKIAAGEVVERPLSVVKELTENAIDAGASVITVEIHDSGLTSVRVTDNGGGIPSEDLPLAFARHATSKISSFDDLMQVQTLGFRGEALSSIAAVSQVEMLTKTHERNTGTRVEIHGGKFISSKEIGCATGTTIIVSNLFYNTPARRKFLKKPATEAGYISSCLERLALGNPALVLRYINNGQIVFQTTGKGDLKTAVLNVYGRESATKTAAVDASVADLRLHGIVGKPEIARSNRRHGSFFINGRYIESKLITRAIESAMKTMLPSGKFPVYVLNLVMPTDALDVNVHPTKMDVRFADEEKIFSFIEDAVCDALEEHNLIPAVRLGDGRSFREKPEPEAEQIPLPFSNERKNPGSFFKTPRKSDYENFRPDIFKISSREFGELPQNNPMDASSLYPFSAREERNSEACEQRGTTKKFFTNYLIQGLIFETYWLVVQGESLFMIDRHAAHERVLYEDLLKKSQQETVAAQNLLTPLPLRLTPREKQILLDNKEIFSRFGFEIAISGGNGGLSLPLPKGGEGNYPTVSAENDCNLEILSVPFLMKGPLSAAFFTELLDKMDDVGFNKNSPYTHKTEIIAMAACKAAIKAGDKMGADEAHALIEQLLELDNPFTCPHGRPTIIEITKNEIERRFKR